MFKLTDKFRQNFNLRTQQRGEDYYSSERVFICNSNDTYLTARVEGSDKYTVELEVDENALLCFCTCPASLHCKHIWAVLYKADKERLIPFARGSHIREMSFAFIEQRDLSKFETPKELDDFPILSLLEEVNTKANSGKSKLKLLSSLAEEKEIDHFNNYTYYIASKEHLLEILDRHKKRYPNGLFVTDREKFWDDTELADRGYPFGFELNYNPDMERTLKALSSHSAQTSHIDSFAAEQEIIYHLNLFESTADEIKFSVYSRRRKADGEWGALKSDRSSISSAKTKIDNDVFALIGSENSHYYSYEYLSITPANMKLLAPILKRTNRCKLVHGQKETDFALAENPAEVKYAIKVKKEKDLFSVYPVLTKKEKKWVKVNNLDYLCTYGFVYNNEWYNQDLSAFELYFNAFEKGSKLELNANQLETFLSKILSITPVPQLILPAKHKTFIYTSKFKKVATFEDSPKKFKNKPQSLVTFSFEYGKSIFNMKDSSTGVMTDKGFLKRDFEAERIAVEEIKKCHIRHNKETLLISNEDFFKNMNFLSSNHWQIKFRGKKIRSGGSVSIKVSSGIDWLEVKGKVTFGETSLSLVELLSKVKDEQNLITLSDGSLGYLENKELLRIEKLLQLGKKTKDSFQFHNSQTFIIDALLEEQDNVVFDASFKKAQKRLQQFSGIGKEKAPKSFKGKLRPYQQEGLAWLNFTREFGVGACLADDMGLGKTIQVIALLEQRRLNKIKKPTLIVVPTSLIFNWLNELEKFAPKIKALNHTGINRTQDHQVFAEYNIVLTTYGLLRNSITTLTKQEWDYAILDEGQAIKNANTASAKASRLIQADHRIIMSGTPIENHLGELWSLFEFLNPGMLGSARAFDTFNVNTKDSQTLKAFSKALRPMILRRKKEDVLKDLPDKTEQTLFCEMDKTQEKFYKGLRDTYRKEILKQDDKELKKNKFRVLEALTRLRQAACHPSLIKPELKNSSCKLDLVIPQILEVMDEGHKVLVFSQFTKFLALVKERLDEQEVSYEYLDGSTRNRQEKVRNFQENDKCQLFLISLKAGGTGLNLTKAEYVYILDPWWNPAAEAQAIDRAHRIGQTQKVFAYRVITKNTIEEKILELQQSKKDLADSILADDNKGLRNLTRNDLENLFS